MSRIAVHSDARHTPILATTSGEMAIFFVADLDVNTDGAARSYHPEDPRGRTLALNNMGNAITKLVDVNGRNITCSPRQGACFTRFMDVFEESRDAGYNPVGHRRFETDGIIPWKEDAAVGHPTPCTISSGPFAGYFVSQTALVVDASAGVCDQARYLDSLSMDAIVLPGGVRWSSQGTRTDGGDLAALLDLDTGKVAFALVGDSGPRDSIGEGTVALAAALGDNTVSPTATYREIKALARPHVATVLFPSRDVPRLTNHHFTQADIDRLGEEALEVFGGKSRMAACAAD